MKSVYPMLRYFLFEKSIYRTILFSYLLVNLLLLLLLGVLSIRDSTRMITDEIIKSSNKVMEQAAQGIGFNLEETKRSLVMLAGNYATISIMTEKSPVVMANILNHERAVAEIASGIYTFQSLISDVLILGKNGYVNNLDGRKSLRWDYRFGEQPWVKTAFNAKPQGNFFSVGVHKQDYYLEHDISRYNQPTLSVAMQVRGFGGEVVGAVIANLDLQKMNGMFERNAYQSGGNIFMIDENRRIIVHQDSGKIGQILDIEGLNTIDRNRSGHYTAKINGEEHLVIFQPTDLTGWIMISTVPMSEITSQSAPIKTNLARMLYLGIVLNILISLAITFRISSPVNKLLRTLDRLGEEDTLYVKTRNYRYRELNHIGTKFMELMDRINLLIRQNYLSRIALKEEELKALQSQINPHFLFNTLQLLQTEIVCGNIESSNHIVVSLSNLFRYSMRQSEELVDLKTELDHVKDYLYIMNKKYSDRVAYTCTIADPAILHYQIPKLILQPVVENSIRHGFGDDRREGSIQIRVSLVRKGLLITIRDNGKGMDKNSLRSLRQHIGNSDRPTGRHTGNIGLYNVSQRIKLKYGDDYGLRIRSAAGVHMTVYILLPVMTKDHMERGDRHEAADCG